MAEWKLVLGLAVISLLAGCATAPHTLPSTSAVSGLGGIHHTVKGGETLWGISRLYGVDLNTLVQANSLQDSSTIAKGQVLFIPKAAVAYRATKMTPERSERFSRYPVGEDSFIWPIKGRVLSPYGSKIGNIRNKGVDIQAEAGGGIRASRAGRVVYCDSYLKGFGKTVILDHGDNYQTVYSYNSDILVKVGDEVQQNEVIAKAGKTGRAKEPSLHFEIRKDGEPQNPTFYLP